MAGGGRAGALIVSKIYESGLQGAVLIGQPPEAGSDLFQRPSSRQHRRGGSPGDGRSTGHAEAPEQCGL